MKSGLFSTFATLFGGFDAFAAPHPSSSSSGNPPLSSAKKSLSTRVRAIFCFVSSQPLAIAANFSFKSRYPSSASSVVSTVFSMGQMSVPARLMMRSVNVP